MNINLKIDALLLKARKGLKSFNKTKELDADQRSVTSTKGNLVELEPFK